VNDDSDIFWKRFAPRTGVPLEGLSFIYHAFRCAQDSIADELSEKEVRRRHCSAAYICRWFICLAQEKFGEDYIAALKSWNLDTSEKLGIAVYALIGRNLLDRQYPDTQSDFEGRFNFSQDSAEATGASPYPYPTNYLPRVIDPYRFSLRTLLIIVTLVALVLGSLAISK
jgi:uncharacterized repeat protein (TIGR04138 family)